MARENSRTKELTTSIKNINGYIGQGTGAAAEALAEIVPDALGLGLLHHSHTEWKYLATFLPGLFYGDRRTGHSVPSHW